MGEQDHPFSGSPILRFIPDSMFNNIGAWRSLVAHSFGVRVVGRSNRLAPTIFKAYNF